MQAYLQKFIVQVPIKISKILKKININEKGIVFVVDKNLKLKGRYLMEILEDTYLKDEN